MSTRDPHRRKPLNRLPSIPRFSTISSMRRIPLEPPALYHSRRMLTIPFAKSPLFFLDVRLPFGILAFIESTPTPSLVTVLADSFS
jgi:hypothetical protein